MGKTDLGAKQSCPSCGAKFYDLNRRPAVCPKCTTSFDPAEEGVRARRGRSRVSANDNRATRFELEDGMPVRIGTGRWEVIEVSPVLLVMVLIEQEHGSGLSISPSIESMFDSDSTPIREDKPRVQAFTIAPLPPAEQPHFDSSGYESGEMLRAILLKVREWYFGARYVIALHGKMHFNPLNPRVGRSQCGEQRCQ